MKYLSKEELEDITKELLENPTRETLKVLNNKYNSEKNNDAVEQVKESVPVQPSITETKLDIPTFEVPKNVNTTEDTSASINTPNFNIPQNAPTNKVVESWNMDATKQPSKTIPISSEASRTVSNNLNNAIPSLEVPQSAPVQNNNTRINFSGNLWEPQMPTIGNMMETTDNFNTSQNTMPNMNINSQNNPFFGPATETVNNPIPVNNVPNNGQSMFGQIQQNYNQGA